MNTPGHEHKRTVWTDVARIESRATRCMHYRMMQEAEDFFFQKTVLVHVAQQQLRKELVTFCRAVAAQVFGRTVR